MLIFFNGCSSSGKSTLIKAFQFKADTPWLSVGIDSFWAMMPNNYIMYGPQSHNGFYYVPGRDGQGPTMEVKNGEFGMQVMRTIPQVINTMADNKLDLLIDEVVLEEDLLRGYVKHLAHQKVYFVWVHCDLKTLEEREILRGNRGQGLARMQMKIVPTLDWPYDLTVDTTNSSSFEVAAQIMEFVKKNPDPQSFHILRKRWNL